MAREILVVEEDHSIRELWGIFLQAAGLEAVFAYDYDSALYMYRDMSSNGGISAIIIDPRLDHKCYRNPSPPWTYGVEFIHRLRAESDGLVPPIYIHSTDLAPALGPSYLEDDLGPRPYIAALVPKPGFKEIISKLKERSEKYVLQEGQTGQKREG